MSVQFLKIFFIVVVLHCVALSLTWVGFPVPLPRPSAEFVYLGSSSIDEPAATPPVHQQDDNQLKRLGSSLVAPWSKIRQINKPKFRNHDHLEF